MMIFGRPHDDSTAQSSSVDTEEGRRFDIALSSTIDAFEAKNIDYGLIGGVAAFTHGRPRPTQDIDIFVRPEDADSVLDVLKQYGFETNRTNPSWIFKAFKEGVLIDIIFRSNGNIYFDAEMSQHTVEVSYHGRRVRVVCPEDFTLIKAAAHNEEGQHHWYDAMATLAQSKLNWEYLLHRARKAPRRLLALLVYAQSVDIWIPNDVIKKLYQYIFDETARHQPLAQTPVQKTTPMAKLESMRNKGEVTHAYLEARIQEALTENEKTGAMGIDVLVRESKILVRGLVNSEEQKKAICGLIKEIAPNLYIEDQLRVSNFEAPKNVEALQ
jgi:predicted nucleotidyltransferase